VAKEYEWQESRREVRVSVSAEEGVKDYTVAAPR
jgi:hypothetical protein